MKAVIFDMDGVILDSEIHWKKAELSLFNKIVANWTKDDQHKIVGLSIHDTYRLLANDFGLTIGRDDFLERVMGVASDVYRNKANLMPDFLEFIKNIKSKNIPTALASSSLRRWIDLAIGRFSLKDYFDYIISSEDVDGKGKPAPDIYLFAAQRLGIDPKECLVIEDSRNGVVSAKSAGMYCVGLRNGFNEKQDLSTADREIEGFIKINNNEFFNLFTK